MCLSLKISTASMSASGTKGEKEVLSHAGWQLLCVKSFFLQANINILLQVCKLAPGQRCIKKLNEKLVSAMIKVVV